MQTNEMAPFKRLARQPFLVLLEHFRRSNIFAGKKHLHCQAPFLHLGFNICT